MALDKTKMCKECGSDYEFKRQSSRFCSTKCRVYNARSVTVSVTEKPVSVTSDETLSELRGIMADASLRADSAPKVYVQAYEEREDADGNKFVKDQYGNWRMKDPSF